MDRRIPPNKNAQGDPFYLEVLAGYLPVRQAGIPTGSARVGIYTGIFAISLKYFAKAFIPPEAWPQSKYSLGAW